MAGHIFPSYFLFSRRDSPKLAIILAKLEVEMEGIDRQPVIAHTYITPVIIIRKDK